MTTNHCLTLYMEYVYEDEYKKREAWWNIVLLVAYCKGSGQAVVCAAAGSGWLVFWLISDADDTVLAACCFWPELAFISLLSVTGPVELLLQEKRWVLCWQKCLKFQQDNALQVKVVTNSAQRLRDIQMKERCKCCLLCPYYRCIFTMYMLRS